MSILFEQIENANSNEPVTLDADQKKCLKKAMSDFYGVLSFLSDHNKNDSITKSIRHTVLGCLDGYNRDLKKVLGTEEDEKQEYDLNTRKFRELNGEIRRLQEEMGKKISCSGISAKLYELNNIVDEWWKGFGFLLAQGSFTGTGMGDAGWTGKFSVILGHGCSSYSDTPVSDEQDELNKISDLAGSLDIADGGNRFDYHVLDTEKSRNWFLKKFHSRFPGGRIHSFKNLRLNESNDSQRYFIREIKAYIPATDIEQGDK